MKLFHWKTQGIDFLLMAKSEDEARAKLVTNINEWRWQNPERFDAVLTDVKKPPLFVAEPLYVIAIDSKQPA
jgi:hypothetical protein